MESLSDRILRENAEAFQAMVRHRFVLDIEDGHLPPNVFDRYLVIEGAFVDTAIAIFAFAVAKAPGIEERRWLIRVLDSLANEQVAYFERTFAQRGVSPAMADLADPRVSAFREGMLAIAQDGSFLDIVAAMFAAEWMYWTWCSTAAGGSLADEQVREWIRLHTEPAFASQAGWLRERLDEAGPYLPEAQQNALIEVFGRVQRLEIAFHDAAYGTA